MTECPGAKPNRDLDELDVTCPACGAELEFFSDEIDRKCKCGATVKRDGTLGGDATEHANRAFEVADDPQARQKIEDVGHQVQENASDA